MPTLKGPSEHSINCIYRTSKRAGQDVYSCCGCSGGLCCFCFWRGIEDPCFDFWCGGRVGLSEVTFELHLVLPRGVKGEVMVVNKAEHTTVSSPDNTHRRRERSGAPSWISWTVPQNNNIIAEHLRTSLRMRLVGLLNKVLQLSAGQDAMIAWSSNNSTTRTRFS